MGSGSITRFHSIATCAHQTPGSAFPDLAEIEVLPVKESKDSKDKDKDIKPAWTGSLVIVDIICRNLAPLKGIARLHL